MHHTLWGQPDITIPTTAQPNTSGGWIVPTIQGSAVTASNVDVKVPELGKELEKLHMRIDQLDEKLELILELLETRKA